MNRASRRGASRVAGATSMKVADRACQVCAYIASHIVGARARDYKDQATGELIELHINERLQPPYGVRFPSAKEKRTPCLECAGVGKFGCKDCHGSGQSLDPALPCPTCGGQGKTACAKCHGQGVNWVREDFAPTCNLCSQFLMAWLQEREQSFRAKRSPAASRILIPTQQQARRTGGIVLP